MILSVIVPVYNNEKYIERCIDSIIDQKTSLSYDIIVVDDGSTDSTQEKIKKYNEKIKIFKIENHGVSYARRFGVEKSNSKYVMFVDSDDYVENNFIESIFEKYTNGILPFARMRKVYEDKETDMIENVDTKDTLQIIKKIIDGDLFCSFCRTIFEKEKFLEIPVSDMKYSEDLLFVLEYILKYKFHVKTTEEVVYNYYMENESSATNNSFSKKYIEAFKELPLCVDEILLRYNVCEKFKNNCVKLIFMKSLVICCYVMNFKEFKNAFSDKKYGNIKKYIYLEKNIKYRIIQLMYKLKMKLFLFGIYKLKAKIKK